MTEPRIRRLVGVSLNAAIDRIASVERLVPGTIHRPQELSALPGGKAANVLRAARHLGLPGELVAVLGGHAGAWYREALAARDIGIEAVEVSGETRTCLSVLDEAAGTLTEFYAAGVTLTDADWPRVEGALERALRPDGRDALVVLAGSLPPGAPTDAYARLARVASRAGARAAVDIAGEPLLAALEARPWLVKVNAAEAETATGTSARTLGRAAAAGRTLRARGAVNAIVTRGVHGAVASTTAGTWAVGGVPAALRGPYSVGSGDAFLAGYAVALARGEPPADALRLGAAAGTANARTPGQGELDPDEVQRLAPRFATTRRPDD
ncbi:MAG: hexose kinase [Chloroflexota bacterium]